MVKSIEEKVEDCAKAWLNSYKRSYYAKTDSINSEIDGAMRNAPSKSGGTGGNYPDIRLLLTAKSMKAYPIMIEVKGTRGKLAKIDKTGDLVNTTDKGTPHYDNIANYAVNGAVHYAEAIVKNADSYAEVIAIGLNGYDEAGTLKTELGVYYVSAENLSVPKKVGDYSDLSFLAPNNFEAFVKQVEQLKLTPAEVEAQSRKIEERIEKSLKDLNQDMHDKLHIAVGSRVTLMVGMIMAGLGVADKIAKLEIIDLKGQSGGNSNDGAIVINKIKDFLAERNLPQEKRDMIVGVLSTVFFDPNLTNAADGESKLKTVYIRVKTEILPLFTSSHHLDFTGKLFNVLNEWVGTPDGGRNDVVLTPRYVTLMMAKLAKVDRNSYVWDYAAGSAGFLVSAMKLMVEDAAANIKSPDELDKKILAIKTEQLLGIEILQDIYLLAVLNMILMNDGSTNILQKDSLTQYSGKYEQGVKSDEKFPANVFLLNPPYSAQGKGFIFVKKALARMTSGRAVVLIQENAGSGNGLPYTKELLENNTLLASIHMADIFCGKAGVQTAVYVFEIGKRHDANQIVKFIDMSNDGYSRQNRKKSGLDVNLRNTDNAEERYDEVVALVNGTKRQTNFYTDAEYIEDTITLDGNDWTFSQHKKIDTVPTEADFMKVVSEYLAWEVGQVLKGESANFKSACGTMPNRPQASEPFGYKKFRLGDLFEVGTGSLLPVCEQRVGDISRVSVQTSNNGVIGKFDTIGNNNARHFENFISVNFFGNAFYHPYKASVEMKVHVLTIKDVNYTREAGLYLVGCLNKIFANRYSYGEQLSSSKIKTGNFYISLPVISDGSPDFDFMSTRIRELELARIRELVAYLKVTGFTDYRLTASEEASLENYHNLTIGGGGISPFRLVRYLKSKHRKENLTLILSILAASIGILLGVKATMVFEDILRKMKGF